MSDETDRVLTRLRAEVPEDVRAGLVDALAMAYEDAASKFDPTVGSNGSTFGIDVYHFAVFQVAATVNASDSGDVLQCTPAFRIGFGSVTAGCHRVGDSLSASIHECFPSSEYASQTLTTQLDLFKDVSVPVDQPIGVVLAHRGNPQDGLLSVDLCVPGAVKKGTIVSWSVVLPLWEAGTPQTGSPIKVEVPDVEHVARPRVVLKNTSR